MAMTERVDLTRGNVFKNVLHLAWPMVAGNVLQNAFNVVDMIFVGRLGPSAIAAVALC
jgi:Na+-driven multidrug efflux pump